ncbi:MAG TPA: ornithine carbamoyltransferase [Candidatus Bathyarchaeia archaeon]|nr:ornithine carbamoyltransferase [Candidatus Bathyarchaeia archaeon]
MKNLISIGDLTKKELYDIIELAVSVKRERSQGIFSNGLKHKTIGMIFEKPSTRTRTAFEVAMVELGGYPIYLNWNDLQLGRGETTADTARVLSRYLSCLVVRANSHSTIIDLAKNASVPVINALSNVEHPCQLLADLMTIYEKRGRLSGLKLAWIGDGNNVCNSAILSCALMDMNIDVACPLGYEPNDAILRRGQELSSVRVLRDPLEAATAADVLYTDAWVSMGDEATAAVRARAFAKYRIDNAVLDAANSDAIVLHCLPAHRGQEITDEVMDGPHSVVFDQAENRLHAHKALLLKLLC